MLKPKAENLSPSISWLIGRDWPAVLAIAREAFPRERRHWTEPKLDKLLTARRDTMAMAIKAGGGLEKLLGFAIFAVDEQAILVGALAIDRDYRRSGLGSMLVNQLQSRCELIRRPLLRFVLTEEQLAGQLLLRRLGFFARSVGGMLAFEWQTQWPREPIACPELGPPATGQVQIDDLVEGRVYDLVLHGGSVKRGVRLEQVKPFRPPQAVDRGLGLIFSDAWQTLAIRADQVEAIFPGGPRTAKASWGPIVIIDDPYTDDGCDDPGMPGS